MDQWGVGRKGFDDGLVILFDLNAERHVPRPGPAVRRPRVTAPSSCPTRSASRSTRTTCCRCSSGATSTARCWWRWTRSTPPRRPSTPRALTFFRHPQRGARPARRAAAVRAASSAARCSPGTATVATPSTSTTRRSTSRRRRPA